MIITPVGIRAIDPSIICLNCLHHSTMFCTTALAFHYFIHSISTQTYTLATSSYTYKFLKKAENRSSKRERGREDSHVSWINAEKKNEVERVLWSATQTGKAMLLHEFYVIKSLFFPILVLLTHRKEQSNKRKNSLVHKPYTSKYFSWMKILPSTHQNKKYI